MAVITMLVTPSSQMRIGMRADIRLMAERTTGPGSFTGMTTEAMTPIPAGLVRLRPGIRMTGITGILLMTHQTALTIPGALNPVGLQPPEIIVRGRHRDLMTFPA